MNSRAYEKESDDTALCEKCKEPCAITYILEEESDVEVDRYSNCCGGQVVEP